MKDKLGIPYFSSCYVNLNENQNLNFEIDKIKNILKQYRTIFSLKNKIDPIDVNLEFLNYGSTQLVFVLRVKGVPKYTVLVGQPSLEFKKVKQEADNLTALNKIDKTVIAPVDYYTNGTNELFVTPYIYQARCIASNDNNWGVYIPEPFYRFESFDIETRHNINKCMIAKLVSLFNKNSNEGVAMCKLGGGDFMLPKSFEASADIENTLESLLLIAAREKINCTLDEYLELIKNEFNKVTINKHEIKINFRARVAMTDEEIKEGIKLGLKLLKERELNKKTLK